MSGFSGFPTGAWTAFTAVATPGAGTITTQSSASSFLKFGKTLFFRIAITVSNVGSASGTPTIALPSSANFAALETLIGREAGVGGKLLAGAGAVGVNTFAVVNFDNSSISWTNGIILAFAGVIEIQ